MESTWLESPLPGKGVGGVASVTLENGSMYQMLKSRGLHVEVV